jgi:hypothetical protein
MKFDTLVHFIFSCWGLVRNNITKYGPISMIDI